MTTRTVERHRTKCGQYWPELEGVFNGSLEYLSFNVVSSTGSNVTYGIYNIKSENIENYEDFIVTDLKLTNAATGEERQVCHFQFTSWPDYGTPDSALSMLQFLQV